MSRRAVWIALAVVHAAILLAGFFAPYSYDEQHRDFPYVPPMPPHWFDAGRHFHLRPFVFGLVFDAGTWREDASRIYPIRFLVPSAAGSGMGVLPLPLRIAGVQSPGVLFLLGSDAFGRDVFSRVLYGAQVSVLTGFIAAGVSLLLG
jgi:peptide/nickel transport system permease protein